MQSVSPTHTVAQALGPQTYGSQARTTGGAQAPAPSQNVARVSVPALHDGEPHIVVDEALAQV